MRPTTEPAHSAPRSAAVLSAVMAACAAEAPLELSLLDPDQCAEYCATQLEITVGDQRPVQIPCGASATFDLEVDAPTSVEVIATGAGFPLAGQTVVTAESGQVTEVAIVLSPTERPRIDEVTSARPDLLGDTLVTIQGSGFGSPDGVFGVRIGDRDIESTSWTDTRILVDSEVAGDVQVTRCGVASSTRSLDATEVQYATRPFAVPQCADARLAAADGGARSLNDDDRLFAAFSCGTGCSDAVVARLDGDRGELIQTFPPEAGCPFDIAVSDAEGLAYVAFQRDIVAFRNEGDGTLSTIQRERLNFNKVTVVADDFAQMAGRRDIPWLWPAIGERPFLAFSGRVSIANDVDGPYLTGIDADGDFVAARIDTATIAEEWSVTCGEPRALARPNPGPNPSPRFIVACDDALNVFDIGEPTVRIGLPGNLGEVYDAALTRDGQIALLYTEAGTLVFVGIDEGWTTTREIGTPDPSIATLRTPVLERAPLSDNFFITGLRYDELIHIDVTARTSER